MTMPLGERQPSGDAEYAVVPQQHQETNTQPEREGYFEEKIRRAMAFTALGGPISKRELETPDGVYLFPAV